MTKRTLIILVLVCIVLGGLLFLSPSSFDQPSGRQVRLLSDVEGEQIRKIVIEKGPETVELEFNDGMWRLPARASYPANATKVRSLLLKLLDLSSSQVVPSSEQGLKALGLDEQGVKDSYARVRLYDGSQKELGGLYIGKVRTSSQPAQMPGPPGSGQYVRRTDSNTIYLVGSPIMLSTDILSWLDTALVNILPSLVHRVVQKEVANDTRNVLFEIERKPGDKPELTLLGDIPAGQELNDAVFSQVTSGLENLNIVNVHKPDAPEAQGLTFDRETTYFLNNGLVYNILTAAKDDTKLFAKLSVSFDEQLAKTPAETAQKPEPATPEEAQKRNDQYSTWIFELASYQGAKFRKTRDDLLKKVGEEKAPPPQELTGN